MLMGSAGCIPCFPLLVSVFFPLSVNSPHEKPMCFFTSDCLPTPPWPGSEWVAVWGWIVFKPQQCCLHSLSPQNNKLLFLSLKQIIMALIYLPLSWGRQPKIPSFSHEVCIEGMATEESVECVTLLVMQSETKPRSFPAEVWLFSLVPLLICVFLRPGCKLKNCSVWAIADPWCFQGVHWNTNDVHNFTAENALPPPFCVLGQLWALLVPHGRQT